MLASLPCFVLGVVVGRCCCWMMPSHHTPSAFTHARTYLDGCDGMDQPTRHARVHIYTYTHIYTHTHICRVETPNPTERGRRRGSSAGRRAKETTGETTARPPRGWKQKKKRGRHHPGKIRDWVGVRPRLLCPRPPRSAGLRCLPASFPLPGLPPYFPLFPRPLGPPSRWRQAEK